MDHHRLADATDIHNKDLYAELVNQYGDKLLRLATIIIGDPQLSEDVVQDSFMALYNNIKSFRGDSSYYTWLVRVTINKSKNLVTRQSLKKFLFLNDTLPKSSGPTPEEELLLTEEQLEIRKILFSLPLKYRDVLYLYYFEEMKVKAIAEIMDMSEAGIKTRLQRGRQYMRCELIERGIYYE